MQFARLRSLVPKISRFESGNGFQSKLYSSKARPSGEDNDDLMSRISSVENPNLLVVPVLDRWGEKGLSDDRETLIAIINKLCHQKLYHHALEISLWMTNKRCYELTSFDAAFRLGLILKVQGIEQAERYFNNLPQKLLDRDVYHSLLKCFAGVEHVEKAEAVMQKMRDLGFAMVTKDYNFMLYLYYKIGKMEKFDALLKEMEENAVVRDKSTLDIQLSAYTTVMDIEGMDKIVMMWESDPKVVPSFSDYIAAAIGYRKAGLPFKAYKMLKKAEALLRSKPGLISMSKYNQLLTQYTNMEMKMELLRVWSEYKIYKVENKGYSQILNSLVKLGDFEMAEEIFDEWESQHGLTYNMNIRNIMIGAYSSKGLMKKAEALIERAISKGGKPNAWTWYHLVEGYFQNKQPQKAVEMMKKTIVLISGIKWEWEPVPEVASLKACLEYLKAAGDTQQTEEFVKLLVDKDIISLDKLEELSMDKDERLSVTDAFVGEKVGKKVGKKYIRKPKEKKAAAKVDCGAT
ncbi:pentatricopeptide repeat-containing protein At2g20710, mitochondrial-like [Euphorbia lathyris]|uniref:pentatricopeptide repeat-containing protein At2g20710, mitochondrial-like n=1 Tax=Euphorbia lathyris TaxID=212925 RepID=UPI0033132A8E